MRRRVARENRPWFSFAAGGGRRGKGWRVDVVIPRMERPTRPLKPPVLITSPLIVRQAQQGSRFLCPSSANTKNPYSSASASVLPLLERDAPESMKQSLSKEDRRTACRLAAKFSFLWFRFLLLRNFIQHGTRCFPFSSRARDIRW